jgi:glutathione S-transferase
MLTLYGSDLSGPAIKTRLVASFLGLDYKWHIVNLREKEQKQEWFLKINPVGKIPAMDDSGFHLFESNAICRYLADKANSPIYPKDSKARAIVEQWIDFITAHISAHVSSVAFNRIFAPRTGRPVSETAVVEATNFLNQYFPVIENQLSEHKYIVSNQITLADIVLFSMLEPAELAGVDLSSFVKLTAWRKALKQEKFYTSCYQEYGAQLKAAHK